MSPILANSDHWSSVSDHFDIGQGPLVSLVNFKLTSGQPLVNPWSTSGQLIVIIHHAILKKLAPKIECLKLAYSYRLIC